MKFVYLATRGASDPTGASIPIHLAVNGSVAVGHDTAILLAGDATDLLVGNNPATVEGVGLPPLRELLEKVKSHAVPVYV